MSPMSQSKQQDHRIVSILHSIQTDRLERIVSHVQNPAPTSILQTWYFVAAALLVPDWLCSEQLLPSKKQLQQVILDHPAFIQEVLTKYNIDDRWHQGNCNQEDLIDSFAALAVIVDISDSVITEDIKIFLQYTQYIFSAKPFEFSQAIYHAKLLIKDLGIDFGYVADYLEDIADNEHLMNQPALSLEETENCLSSWIKQQYTVDVNQQQWIEQLTTDIRAFLTTERSFTDSASKPILNIPTGNQLGIAIIQQTIYLYWKGTQPPLDIVMGEGPLLPELSESLRQHSDICYWKLPQHPSPIISFQWNAKEYQVDLRQPI